MSAHEPPLYRPAASTHNSAYNPRTKLVRILTLALFVGSPLAAGEGKTVRWDGAPWRDATGDRKTLYAQAAGLPLALTFDPATGTTLARWPESYPGCHDGFEFAWYATSEDIHAPEARKRELAVFLEAARVQRTGGTVIGSFLADASGRVMDVCVVAAHPPGLGFEQATVDAYLRSTFGPATRNGEPLAVAAAASMEFEVNAGMSFSSVLAQAWFESVETPQGTEKR